jgi:hypothetical protein
LAVVFAADELINVNAPAEAQEMIAAARKPWRIFCFRMVLPFYG